MRRSPEVALRHMVLALLIIAVAGMLAACSGASTETEDSDPPPAGSTIVDVTAADFSYTLSESEVPAGTVTFQMTNNGQMSHDLVIEGGPGGATDVIGPGEITTVTVELEPGTYTLYCSVSNHRALGMEIEITVT